ncbi:MAG: RNase adapter RapZ [Oscillospiraceae bacterium]|nr:RNase adapter RapZ [Oscillospiraceae bacterium]
MQCVIVTGLSGAGKSRTIDALEDIGFYCVDNIPPKLISKFVELSMQSEGKLDKLAIVTDVRGGDLFNDFLSEIDKLKEMNCDYKILFLDADSKVLIDRYKFTRRKHPLMEQCGSLEAAVAKERRILRKVRERASYVIDTTFLTAMQLKERILKIFLNNIGSGMFISCVSFGFKHGVPSEADLVFDVRCLPNPFYIEELKNKTGLDKPVSDYVMQFEQSKTLKDKLFDLIDFLQPLYISEGKSSLVIAIGCTGGHHRSVTFAELLNEHLLEKGYNSSVTHRDILK